MYTADDWNPDGIHPLDDYMHISDVRNEYVHKDDVKILLEEIDDLHYQVRNLKEKVKECLTK